MEGRGVEVVEEMELSFLFSPFDFRVGKKERADTDPIRLGEKGQTKDQIRFHPNPHPSLIITENLS